MAWYSFFGMAFQYHYFSLMSKILCLHEIVFSLNEHWSLTMIYECIANHQRHTKPSLSIHLVLGRRTANFASTKKTFDSQSPETVCNSPVLQSWQAEIFSPVLHSDNTPKRQSLQDFSHHSTHSALETLTFHSLHTHFAHQLALWWASVEQNSIGHTQIIISQDFTQIPERLSLSKDNIFKGWHYYHRSS
jgi:hypothetical protein